MRTCLGEFLNRKRRRYLHGPSVSLMVDAEFDTAEL